MRQVEIATLGGGCFWCIEAALGQLQGVDSVVPGYSGGHVECPDYRSVCGGDTGHAEVVQVSFDPAQIDYRTLLVAFFTIHDPTTLNRQGHDEGTQYRSVIFFHTPEQEAVARELIASFTTKEIWEEPIVTEVLPAEKFWPAEDYHRNYFQNNPHQAYCAAVIAPKVSRLRQLFRERIKAE